MDINLEDLFDDKFKSPFVPKEPTVTLGNTDITEYVETVKSLPLDGSPESVEAVRAASAKAIGDKMTESDPLRAIDFMTKVEELAEEGRAAIAEEEALSAQKAQHELFKKQMAADSSEMSPVVDKPKIKLSGEFHEHEWDTQTKAELEVIEGEVVEESELSAATKEYTETKESYEADGIHAEELRDEIKRAQAAIDRLKNQYTKIMDRRTETRTILPKLEVKVTALAHAESEARKAAAIQEQRKGAMLSFQRDIEELNPAWINDAYPHQWEGASTLALHGSGLLADDMGLGKTITSIMWLDMVKAKNVLVVTPNDTNSNFTSDMGVWAKHRFVYPLAGANKETRDVILDALLMPRIELEQDITISVNFEQLYSDADYFDRLMSIKWDAIIIDEAHNFKKVSSVLFNRLKQLKNSNMVEGKSIVKVLPVTGTFILNSPEDIWPALHLVDSDAFPDISQFRDLYCDYNYDTQKWVFRTGGERSMLIHLGGRIVKRTMKEAGIKLPTQTIHDVDLSFDGGYKDQQRVMMQLAQHQIILDSERKTSIVEKIAVITRQRQCAVFPAGIVIKDPETGEVMFSVGDEVRESIKIDWTIAKIKELRVPSTKFPQGERVAVFSQFKTALAELEIRLIDAGIKVVRYDGNTDKDTKMVVKRDFDRKQVESRGGSYEYEVVLCNYKTGGVGLNFTHVTQLIALDEEWNPGKNNQAYARTNRIGQTEENHVWVPRLMESIDEWMHDLNLMKKDIIAGFDSEVDLQKGLSNFLETVAARNID